MLKPKLIIFDLDGVLANTEHYYIRVISDALIKQGFLKYTYSYCTKNFIGTAFSLIISIVEKENSACVDKLSLDKYVKKKFNEFDKHISIVKGAKEFIEELKIPFCIASSSNVEQINKTLRVLKLDKLFTSKTIFSAATLGHFKPDPAVYLEALNKMGFKASETIAIEDSVPGVTAASNANIPTIGFVGADYLKGHRQKYGEKLLVNGAFIIKENFPSIKKLLFPN